jgi:hypothetical protein
MVTRGVAPIHGIMSALGGSRETWAESSQQHEWWVNVQTIDCFPSPSPPRTCSSLAQAEVGPGFTTCAYRHVVTRAW